MTEIIGIVGVGDNIGIGETVWNVGKIGIIWITEIVGIICLIGVAEIVGGLGSLRAGIISFAGNTEIIGIIGIKALGSFGIKVRKALAGNAAAWSGTCQL